MRQIIGVFLFGLTIIGCKFQTNKINERTLIINIAIDCALKLDSGLNTKDYWIDFSKVQYFDKTAIHNFLRLSTNFTEINGDSLIKNNSNWIQYGFLQKMLIEFKKIEFKGDSIIINLDKIKASDESNGLEIIIMRTTKELKVISSKITWIS